MYACENDYDEMAKRLVELGANIYIEDNDEETVFDFAVYRKRKEIIKILIEKIKKDLSSMDHEIAAKAFAVWNEYSNYNNVDSHDYDLVVKNVERANLITSRSNDPLIVVDQGKYEYEQDHEKPSSTDLTAFLLSDFY